MPNHDEIERRFTHHTHDDPAVTRVTLEAAQVLDAMLPDGREKALALTALQECRMWANAAIACEKKG